MKVGNLVRQTKQDYDWILHPGKIGMIVRAANDALGLHLERTRYWEIMWPDGLQVVLDDDLEVVDESR
jgi:hypothetical protein